MNNQASPKQLLQKKQELTLLKQQEKELTLKVRRRQYEYNHHYGIAIAGAVLALMFMETKGLTVFIGFIGIGVFLVSATVLVANLGSKAPRQLKETREKITRLKCEIIEIKAVESKI